jgi:DNA polymerase-1
VDFAVLRGYLETVFGWRLHVTPETRPTSLLNFPMQSNGSEMLRLACIFATEAGVKVCAPIHDALLIEAPLGDIEDAVAYTRACMARAGRIVLGGFEVRTDAEIVRYPDRYADERGSRMWEMIVDLLAEQPSVSKCVSWPRGSYRELSSHFRPAISSC